LSFQSDVDRILRGSPAHGGNNRAAIESPQRAVQDKFFFPASIDPELARKEFPAPIPASQLGGGGAVPWVWEGYLARGYTTLLSGVWKGGKSTLIAHLLRALEEGGALAGVVTKGRALIISEEGQGLWAGRRDDLSLGDSSEFICRPFKGRPRLVDWLGFIQHLARLIAERQFDLVILDTLSAMIPCDDENNAAKMLMSLTPLHTLTEAGAAMLLIHHPRKGDGGEGMAARGSGALPGFVDIILELRRFAPGERENRRRTLTAYSRFDETPANAVIELVDDGYRLVGSKADARHDDRMDALKEILPRAEPGLTVDEVREAWPDGADVATPGRRTLARDLQIAAEGGKLAVGGTGKKGDPRRYWVSNAFLASPNP